MAADGRLHPVTTGGYLALESTAAIQPRLLRSHCVQRAIAAGGQDWERPFAPTLKTGKRPLDCDHCFRPRASAFSKKLRIFQRRIWLLAREADRHRQLCSA
jgi:hypothetical protein